MDDIALPVAHHLHLDVARALDIAFDEQTAIAEIALALAARGVDLGFECAVLAHDAHPLAAAARRRLDQQRVPHRAGPFHEGRRVVILDGGGRHRKAAFLDKGAGADLVAHQVDDLGCGADERDAGLFQCGHEGGIFRQEAIARMHRIRADPLRRLDDLRNVEIGRHGR